jgi:hypothetical protein
MLALGLSFSDGECSRLGIDPEQGFPELLAELRPRRLRLSLYWDRISPEPGVCDLSFTQSALDTAQRLDCGVTLTIGFKPQRHPTFTPPPWLAGASHERLTAGLVMMLERAIALLADYSAIEAWEVEFLPYLSIRQQPSGWSFDSKLVEREAALLREVDPRHRPVVVSHPGGRLLDRGWLKALTVGDILGGVLHLAPRQTVPARSVSIQAQLAQRFGRQLWVTELECGDSSGSLDAHGSLEAARALATACVSRAYLSGFEQQLLQRQRADPDRWQRFRALLQEE